MTSGANNGQAVTKSQAIAAAASRVRTDLAFAVLDVFVVIAAYTIGLGIRMLDPTVVDRPDLWANLAIALPVIVLVHIFANIVAGAYGHVWEHASTSEAVRVAAANAAATAFLLFLSWVARENTGFFDPGILVPYVVVAIGGMLSLLAMGMVRFRSRLFSFHKEAGALGVLVVGTGRDAVAFARNAPALEGGRRVIGFVEVNGNGADWHRKLAGLEVLGSLDNLADCIEMFDVDEVVVVGSDPGLTRHVVDTCLDIDVRLRILPAAEDVIRDGVAAVDARDIAVEDILVRQPVETDLASVMDLIKGRTVLVTGAGGSIGSEIVRQVISFEPGEVWALDRDETLLHDATLRWRNGVNVVLGDIRDARRMLHLFEEIEPDIVFHAAALKHVPMLEDHPTEALLTNVVGTRNVIEAGSRSGMERFVLISTDKAVSPSSVMGATKRIAEIMTQVGGERGDGCIYSAVRFGNVLGSRGSVIPTFVQQIKNGGPVTVTDPAMTRYFMTVDEAVQLVLQASALAEDSEVFVLDMGEPVKIEDLARRLIRLAGLSPDRDIEIQFTGRRPGEKLSEVLSLDPLAPTINDKISEARLNHPRAGMLMKYVAEAESAALIGNVERVRTLIDQLVDGSLSASHEVVDISETLESSSWS